ncbi:MAG TPA: hypothetical protein VFW62_11705, partial [bacterium]|nr:hypothetical protein [bacterium]
PVDFDTDQETTLKALAVEIQATAFIFQAQVTGAREITVTGLLNGETITIVGPTVTGGVAQPVATITQIQTPLMIPAIFADQPFPRPAKPYGTIRLGVEQRLGSMDEGRGFDDTDLAETAGQRVMTVTLNVYGPGAVEQMAKARASLSKQTVRSRFFDEYGIAILNDGNISNLTDFLETIAEERAMMEVGIGYGTSAKDDIGWIDTVEINEEVTSLVD